MGLETARLLASKGAILSISDVNALALEEALQSLTSLASNGSKKHMSTVVDVRSSSQVNEWISATVAALGPLDCAANIAGVLGGSGLIRESTDDDWDFVMGVNAKGVFNCLRAQLSNIKERGSIVNFASTASVAVLHSQVAYNASKHAVLGLTKTAAREEGPRHIRVNCVAPGMSSYIMYNLSAPTCSGILMPLLLMSGITRTPIIDHVDEAELRKRTKRFQCIDRIADPIEVSRVVAFLLSEEASFVTGAYYEVSGGWTA
jgi:arginine metabolism regulation protein II